jgi:hypothetical protein
MTLSPNPELAQQMVRRWCPRGTGLRVTLSRGRFRAAHIRVAVEALPVEMPLSVQVADLLDRYLDREGAVRLRPNETPRQLIAALARHIYGDPKALVLAPVAVAHQTKRKRLRYRLLR